MEGHLLYTNQYTSLRVSSVLMYPLYTAAGLLLRPTHLPPVAAYHLLHLLAALALLAALWRCCGALLPARRVTAFALAVFLRRRTVPARPPCVRASPPAVRPGRVDRAGGSARSPRSCSRRMGRWDLPPRCGR